jgi:hypothetical protein
MKSIQVHKSKDWRWYWKELRGNGCLCGRPKKPRRSFCLRCYRALPADMQRALYRRLTCGYEEAFEEAAAYLHDHVWQEDPEARDLSN